MHCAWSLLSHIFLWQSPSQWLTCLSPMLSLVPPLTGLSGGQEPLSTTTPGLDPLQSPDVVAWISGISSCVWLLVWPAGGRSSSRAVLSPYSLRMASALRSHARLLSVSFFPFWFLGPVVLCRSTGLAWHVPAPGSTPSTHTGRTLPPSSCFSCAHSHVPGPLL